MRINNTGITVNTVNTGVNVTAKRNDSKNIDGRSFNKSQEDFNAKKYQAQKKAMKLIGDVFNRDNTIDTMVEERKLRISELDKQNKESRSAIKNIEQNREELREAYGVDKDSKEQRDLELLAKEKESKFKGSNITLSKDEMEEIAKIKEAGLTDYQKESLSLKEDEGVFADKIYDADNEIKAQNAVIENIKLEKLKDHSMVDVKREANEMLEKETEEIVSLLIEEAKEKIDENSDISKDDMTIEEADRSIKDMMNKMKLMDEDLKGAVVDENL